MSRIPFRHTVKNGQAITHLREAADLIAKTLEARGMSLLELKMKSGLRKNIVERLLYNAQATAHTLVAIERALDLKLPGPSRLVDYRLRWVRPKDDGFEYEVASANKSMRGWRRGTKADVEAYIRVVLRTANRGPVFT